MRALGVNLLSHSLGGRPRFPDDAFLVWDYLDIHEEERQRRTSTTSLQGDLSSKAKDVLVHIQCMHKQTTGSTAIARAG